MRETVKKKMSKKKKILIIVLCVILALMVLAVSAGLIALNWYCKTPDYTVYQTSQNVELWRTEVSERLRRKIPPLHLRRQEKPDFTARNVMFTVPQTESGSFITIPSPIV